ncbi:MAG: 3-isopropylmalate dehydratase large subunit [Ignavibacteriales bacterium]
MTARTVAEKILSEHARRGLRAGDIALCSVDLLMASDTTAPISIRSFEEMGGRRVVNPQNVVFVMDHAAPAPTQQVANLHSLMRRFSAEHGIALFDVGEGVCHQLVVENRYVRPWSLILGADSHTCTYGALGALACGVGSTDLAGAMFTGKAWFRVPETIRVNLTGAFPPRVYAKDLALHLVGRLGANGATYMSIEFYGEPLEAICLADKLTICNMMAETGAKTAVVCDSQTGVASDEAAEVHSVLNVDLSEIEPCAAVPHSVDSVVPVSRLTGTTVNQGFLGSCTNGRIEDIRVAAGILRGRKIPPGVRMFVVPASRGVLLQAIREGLVETLSEAGATFVVPGCASCVGTHNGVPGDGENVISSTNRNFKGRMGNNKAFIYLASPATVAASVVNGKITDPRDFGEEVK